MLQSLSSTEEALVTKFRNFPRIGSLRSTNIWVVEWLPNAVHERRTGEELFHWAERLWPGWAQFQKCNSKYEVLDAIKRATQYADRFGRSPILHIEARGNDRGLSGPDGCSGEEYLSWGEMTEDLQALNVATGCNLLIVVAACIGISGIQSLNRGPRAPAVALVGPIENISPRSLFEGTKELYRRVRDPRPHLSDVLKIASAESGSVPFDYYTFVEVAYDGIVPNFIGYLRPESSYQESEMLRGKLIDYGLTPEEAQSCLEINPDLVIEKFQEIWDHLFCFDLFPENRKRFGLDMTAISLAARDSSPVN